MEVVIENLKERYAKYQAENKKLIIRNAAKELGVSEVELVALSCGTEGNYRLTANFQDLLQEVSSLGYVMALTRNQYCVHERKGIYQNVSFNGHVGLVLDEAIDLRLFMSHWKSGFAVSTRGRKSFQFFDATGTAVHKIYLTDKSNEEAFKALVLKYTSKNQAQSQVVEEPIDKKEELPDTDIKVEEFQNQWKNLKDTHDFFPLLRKFKVSRTQALRLAPEGYAIQLDYQKVKSTLEEIAEGDLPIMVFVGNGGCLQIHSGEINKLFQRNEWWNVLDPEFNLHLNETGIASSWLVKKPTKDGLVHSIELYDAEGENIVLFFGKRKPGIPENENWREHMDKLQK